jgi:putative ABC transport system substrate-binding protein
MPDLRWRVTFCTASIDGADVSLRVTNDRFTVSAPCRLFLRQRQNCCLPATDVTGQTCRLVSDTLLPLIAAGVIPVGADQMAIGRRHFISALGGAAVAWPLAARAQQAERMRHIGVLTSFSEADPEGQVNLAQFRHVLQDLGWTVGRNVEIDYRWTAGNIDSAPRYARELVALAPDVILAAPSNVLIRLLTETRSIPVVFANVSDPIAQGVVTSLARPGGNVTGFSNPPFSLVGKSLQLLKEVAPAVSRVALMISDSNGAGPIYFRVFDDIANTLAITPVKSPFHDRSGIERAIDVFVREPNGGLFVPRDTISEENRDLFVELAARHRLPAVYARRTIVADGGLMSYGSDPLEQYRGAATYVDRILRGDKPGDLPVQEPTKFEFVINLRTAKALGLTVSLTLKAAADEVIE